MKGEGKWIWPAGDAGTDYNEAAEFRATFACAKKPRKACISIAADSWYRLRVNGAWAGDGPGRSWPEHFRYDVIDLAKLLKAGENTLEILVRYFGCGTFHQVPRRGGLIFEVEADGAVAAASDARVAARRWTPLLRNVPTVSVQQEPVEFVDLRRAPGKWGRSAVVCEAEAGPWRGLLPRDCALLTREEVPLRRFVSARRRPLTDRLFAWSPRRLMVPGGTDDNVFSQYPVLAVWQLELAAPRVMAWESRCAQLWIDGARATSPYRLEAGKHLMLGTPTFPPPHDKECSILFREAADCRFSDPEGRESTLFIVEPALMAEGPDIPIASWGNRAVERIRRQAEDFCKQVGRCRDFAALKKQFGHLFRRFEADGLNLDDNFLSLVWAQPEAAPKAVEDPEAARKRGGAATAVHCESGRATELLYDFGVQDCGYWECDVEAPAGTEVTLYAFENMRADGLIQHTGDNHNVLHLVCPGGRFSYLSLKRRSGRYLLISVAAPAAATVKLHYLGLVESTYPFVPQGRFACSEPRLERLWSLSERTLKLCMEDTFTDCPLYEQTLWVGDARNESIFAFWSCGAYDLVRRCLRITGESLERLPIAGCQTPSCWDILLPAWSFMWGMSVEDYWFETADLAFLKEMWPLVKRNLDGARAMIDPASGLFSAHAWNLFEWNPTDNRHKIMIYNSQFLDGAIRSALRLAEVLGDRAFIREYKPVREALRRAIDRTWLPKEKAYAEAWENGAPAERPSVHTSILALLYDEAGRHAARAAENLLEPREDLVPVCSAFASFYVYLAMEKLDEPAAIVERMLRDYQPMIDSDATTVWETYPGSIVRRGDFPTRSHCHAWSAAPLCFLNEVVTGIRMTEPGAAAFEIAPAPVCGLTHAAGVRPTVRGPVEAAWKVEGKVLAVSCAVPKGVKVAFRATAATAGYDVSFRVEER